MGDFLLNVNGSDVRVNASPEETLLSVLRNRLNLTGTKYGCGEGQCGACTVLLDGKATHSCLVAIGSAVESKVVTVEGLDHNGDLSPVQQAFLDQGAFQCGYCTSGMVVRATSLLRETTDPSEEQIVQAMEGNICRCGTYPRIIDAVKLAARLQSKGASR
jgi:aerobic-type carbon monoxide dehydrogenase small subunit (CoxS/CutS family)